MIAHLHLRHLHGHRVALFTAGLNACGYEVRLGPGIGDLFVSWNRLGPGDATATECTRRGIPVIIAENASWGGFVSGDWLHMARTHHNTRGCFPIGDESRWDDLGIKLQSWREDGEEVILQQRGIGSPPVRSPANWDAGIKARARRHPGNGPHPVPLKDDLAKAGLVHTWGSGAAIQALAWGIKVKSYYPEWVGQQGNTDADRLRMFRELAWAQHRLSEIGSGEAFKWLLQ